MYYMPSHTLLQVPHKTSNIFKVMIWTPVPILFAKCSLHSICCMYDNAKRH